MHLQSYSGVNCRRNQKTLNDSQGWQDVSVGYDVSSFSELSSLPMLISFQPELDLEVIIDIICICKIYTFSQFQSANKAISFDNSYLAFTWLWPWNIFYTMRNFRNNRVWLNWKICQPIPVSRFNNILQITNIKHVHASVIHHLIFSWQTLFWHIKLQNKLSVFVKLKLKYMFLNHWSSIILYVQWQSIKIIYTF